MAESAGIAKIPIEIMTMIIEQMSVVDLDNFYNSSHIIRVAPPSNTCYNL